MNFNYIISLFLSINAIFVAAMVEEAEVRGKKGENLKLVKTQSHSPSKASKSYKSFKASKSLKLSPNRSRSPLIAKSNQQNQVCTRKLEAIIYSPSSNVQEYLAKIAAKMRINIKQIMVSFAAGNLAYLHSYIVDYNIYITIINSFGSPVLIGSDISAYTDPIQTVGQAQNYLNRDGYYADSSKGYYNYQFSILSNYGAFVSFVLSLPLSAMTNVPTSCK